MLGPGSASGRGCSCSSLFDPAEGSSFSATGDKDEDEEDDMLVSMQRLSFLSGCGIIIDAALPGKRGSQSLVIFQLRQLNHVKLLVEI